MDNEFLILLQAGLDEAASKELINDDIKNKLQGKINQLQLTAVIDDKSISAIKGQLEKILNHSITISNINIDTGQAAKNAQQAGQKIGDALNQGISSNIKNIKENITSTVKEIHSLDANGIIKKLNLNRASVGNEIVGQVRLLVSEINNLGREAAKTNSDSAWEQLIGKCSKLGNILDTFGKTRSFPGMDDIQRFADYFNGKIIDVGYKNSGLSGTGFTTNQLNKDLNDLSVKFVAAKQGAIELDTIWEEMCNTTGRMDLLNITNAQDQIQTVINELLKAQSIIYGEKGLIAHPNAHGDVSKYLQEVEQARNTVVNLQNEKSALMQKESQEATTAANTIIQNEERKQQAYRETANAYKNISSNESIVKSGAGILTFEGTNNAAKEAQQYFRDLLKDEQAVIATTEQFGKNNNLTSFAVNIKRASGEVESLKYTIDALKDDKGNIEQIFYKLSGSSINDSGAIKQIKAIENAFASFTQKIEQFKSTNSGKLSGLTLPLSDFESKLSGLKNGTNTIDEVRNAFKLLQAEASKIDAPLKRQLSTFDSYKNAIDKGKESISGYRAELKGLANAPKELSQELTKASKLLLQLNRTEVTEGTTVNWSNQAREFVDLLTNIENKINVIKKEQSNAATTQIFNTKDLDAQGKIYIQKVNNTIEKTKSELESKLRNTGYVDIQIKGVEDASGKIKSLTANVTDATGAFKQLNFERAKIQNQGKAQSGFIQTDDVKVIGNISDSVHTVQSSLTALKTKWKEQGILAGEFKSKVEQLESSLISVGSKGELNSLKTQIQTLKNETSTLVQSNKIQLSIDTGGYEAKVKDLISKTRQWADEFGNSRINTDALSKALKNLGDASTTLSNNNTVENQRALINAEKELDTQIQKVTNSIRTMNSETMKSSAVDSLRQKYQEFYDKNGAAHRQWGTQLKQAMLELASGAKISKQRGEELRQELIQIQNAARQAGKLGKSGLQKLFEGFKSFSYWTSSTFLVMKAIQEVRKSVTSVKELDTALVDLKKTTTMTAGELEEFYYTSNDVAKQMGVSTEEIISQASAFSRLGWSSADAATKMAKLSSQFASISPGMSVDEATTNLTSIIKAYDIEVDDILDGVLSKINQVGNTFGTSNAEIAEGLRLSSAAMASLGGTFEENIALFTAGQEILQDASQMGNAIRSITMRIKGYDEDTQEFSKDIVEATGKVADLTKVASNNNMGISMFTDASQTHYKSLVEYLGQISDIWDEIDEKSQVSLLQNLFGKNRAQAGAAIINNFDTVREALEAMEKSAGSADREMSVIMDSLDYKLNRLSETGTGIAQNLFKREDMKSVISILQSFADILDFTTNKLGLFGTAALSFGAFAGFKNIGKTVRVYRFRSFVKCFEYALHA